MFSVIVPTYNKEGTIRRTIDSVLRQSFSDFEIIVVDDGSEDNTGRVVKQLNADRIVYIRTDHSGVCSARNTGIRTAKGKYITFLDSDDEAEKTWLESFNSAFLAKQRAGLVFCGIRVIDTETSSAVVRNPENLGPIFRNQLGSLLAGSFAVVAEAIRKIDGYDEALGYSENTELLLRLARYCFDHNLETVALDTPQIIYYKYKDHDRNNYEKRANAMIHIIEKHRRLLESDRKILATYYSIAGVNLARLKRNSSARLSLLQALKVQPGKVKHIARLLLMLSPPLARFLWKKC